MSRHKPDRLHIANVHTFQTHGRADTQTAGIVEVGDECDLLGENATRAAHEEDQNSECDAREQDSKSDAKLRPLQLFLTRQGGWRNNSMTS